tara:strand:- start:38 stop:676 length:639 start_codon:yes stop_codon:yes gene_type:complete
MKKALIYITLILLPALFIGQEQRITLNEARLVEKHNQILKGLPEILLEAYCKGEIAAYYPKYLKAQVSFKEFMNYAYLEDPTYNDQGTLCPGEYCKLSKEDLKLFQRTIEFVEIEKRAQVGQEPSKMIYYLILKIHKDGKNYNGPVFFAKDILALKEKYKLYNPKNDAAPISIQKLFLARMFSSRTIKDFTDLKFNPWKSKAKNTSDDLYEY